MQIQILNKIKSGFVGSLALTIILLLMIVSTIIISKTNSNSVVNRSAFNHTTAELAEIKVALGKYFDDNLKFPTSSSGLTALIYNADSVPNWQGPYISLGLSETKLDAFTNPYNYHVLNQAGTSEVVVVSGGLNKVVEATGYSGWSFGGYPFTSQGDDILINLSKP